MNFNKKKIKRVSLWILFSLIVLFIILWGLLIFLNRPQYHEPDTRGWQTGDIFFSVGDSWKSHAVRSFTTFQEGRLIDSTPSHCGIVVFDGPQVFLVHESTTAECIVKERPHEYMSKNGSLMIYSRRVPYPIDTLKLRSDVSRLLSERKPFDFSFDHHDTTALYCSELVLYLLEHNGIDQFSDLRKQNYVYPQDILLRCETK